MDHLNPTAAATRGEAVQRIADYGERLDVSEPENVVAEVLTDARHFCDANNLDFAHIDRQAYHTYQRDRQ